MSKEGEGISEQVARLAKEIRELKASLAAEGVAKDAINRNEAVLAKVAALQALKSQLDCDDPARDEAILARLQAEREQRQRQEQAASKALEEELKAVEKVAPRPLIQRKIFHLFCHAGNGDSFHYEPPPRLNSAQCGFGEGSEPHPPVYITEKWDGTTMQATSSHIFKRLDLWGKRKSADPSQRYDLRLVAWRDQDSSWRGLELPDARTLRESISSHLPRLEKLEDGLCVYFEVVHTDINANFKNLPGFADIRVFDFSLSPAASSRDAQACGEFLPFEETVSLAAQYGLPLVGWERRQHLSVTDIWEELAAAAKGRNYATAPAQLEGFVVREAGAGGRIAKARVEHMLASEVEGTSLHKSCFAHWERQALSVSHLAAIGLPAAAVLPTESR